MPSMVEPPNSSDLYVPPGDGDLADDVKDEVLGQEVLGHLALEREANGRRDLDEKLARADDEGGIRVAHAARELAECARVARVRVRPEEHLPRFGVALLRERNVADALVLGVGLEVGLVRDVVKVLDVLLGRDVAKDVHVAVAQRVVREDEVLRDDDYALVIPNLGILAELALEDAEGRWTAHVVREKLGNVRPHVLPWNYTGGPVRMAAQYLLSQRHRALHRPRRSRCSRGCRRRVQRLALRAHGGRGVPHGACGARGCGEST